MNTQVDENIETIYDEYLEEAEQVKIRARTLPFPNIYTLGAIIGSILMLGALFFNGGFYILFGGAFITFISIGLVYISFNPRGKMEADKSAKSRPGFTEFYQLYSKGKYWPYQIVTGEKYDKFLSIIGRKTPQ
jgi:hypothetical protein